MSVLDDGFGGYLVLALICALAHESWRWLGLVLGQGIDADGAVFRWVRAVSSALVAGLCMRLVLFPSGALIAIALEVRLLALAVGLAAFFFVRQTLAVGIGAGAVALLLLDFATKLLMR